MLLGVRCVMKKWSRDPPPGHRGACYQRSPATPDVVTKKNSTRMLSGSLLMTHEGSAARSEGDISELLGRSSRSNTRNII